jgi:septal ring factor EnvC (AmiA/AmiB activator)
MALKLWLSAAVFCLAASGCSTNDILIKKQTEMEARLEQLIQGNAGTNARLAEMTNELRELQNQVKANSADLAELKPGYQELKSSLAGVAQKVEVKTTQTAAAKIVADRGRNGIVPVRRLSLDRRVTAGQAEVHVFLWVR